VAVRTFFVIKELKVARIVDKKANLVGGECDVKSVMTSAMKL